MTSMKLILALALVTGACSKNTAATTASPISDPVPMTEREPSTSTTDAASAPAGAMLASYERVRTLLAADELKGVAEAARKIEVSGKTAAGSAPGSASHFTAIANGATKLAAASDLKAARASFAEVSRHVVELLASDKALARGQHVFECPMVEGYKKWVQPSEDLQNPYMGKRMLACGGESTWQ